MCRLSWNLRASTSWNPQGLSRPVMGLLYIYQCKTYSNYTFTWSAWTVNHIQARWIIDSNRADFDNLLLQSRTGFCARRRAELSFGRNCWSLHVTFVYLYRNNLCVVESSHGLLDAVHAPSPFPLPPCPRMCGPVRACVLAKFFMRENSVITWRLFIMRINANETSYRPEQFIVVKTRQTFLYFVLTMLSLISTDVSEEPAASICILVPRRWRMWVSPKLQ